MHSGLRFAATLLAAVLITSAAGLADPYADVAQFGQALAAAKSYHMSVTGDNGRTVEIDFVAPGKMHMTMGQGIEAIMIDSDTWINMQGSWMHVPGGMGAQRMQGFVANVHSAIPSGDYKHDYTVTDLGMKDGYHAYDVTHKSDSNHSVIYLMPNSLPARIESDANGKTTTIVFSNFNSPGITISPPAQ